MSAGAGNPFWRTGGKGKGLPRKPGAPVIEERGASRRGDGIDPAFPDRDWIGHAQQGGGVIPLTNNWSSSPKERQDRAMGDSTKHLK